MLDVLDKPTDTTTKAVPHPNVDKSKPLQHGLEYQDSTFSFSFTLLEKSNQLYFMIGYHLQI